MTLNALKRPIPLRKQVYERLRTALRAGDYPPSKRLTEVGLARELGVSRTPVREALGLLSKEGLLTALPHGGYKVPSLGAQDVEEVLEIRRLLEPYAASQAAKNATRDGVAGMYEAVEKEKQHLMDAEASVFAEAHRAFRQHLFDMAKNIRLADTIEQYEDYAFSVDQRMIEDWESRNQIIRGQEKLLSAMRDRDSEAAAFAMNAMLEDTRRMMLERLKPKPEPETGPKPIIRLAG
jgi:DNA-binding GntR family transcriptional regulator